MRTSELIDKLSSLIEDYGDLPVYVEYENIEPHFHVFPMNMIIIASDGSL